METKGPRQLCQKLEQSFIEPVGDVNCILKKPYYMNPKFDYS